MAGRSPRDLARQLSLRPTATPGVFDIPWGLRHIRLVVLSEIDPHPRNAAWELFSAQADRIAHGTQQYRSRRPGAEALLHTLLVA